MNTLNLSAPKGQ